ncbi:hypothetical protein [Silvanigrella aquatica]|uniref:Uncharacterized protein n=1 Tax=Silvanigrella aquatica TaxID=1915309 RepID=A0A1L4D494_9BACT|nr:hypothetical protein [Silvanigrella aquatica]APJ05018.1 hypothetical protein AXG55_14405 [Silvanigrella aquatica]
MNKDLKAISLLFGQLSSSLILIIIIWSWETHGNTIDFFGYLSISPAVLKVFFTLAILGGSIISLYRILKMLTKENQDDGDPK